MPPRKDASQTQQDASSSGIDNFELPKSIVTRLAKSALPHDAKLQKDTVMALIKGSTVFINYLVQAPVRSAQDVASSRSHKTIASADVLKALEMLEFGDLVPILESELELYRGGGKTDKGKGKSVDAKGKGKESSPADAKPEAVSTAQEPDVPNPDDSQENERENEDQEQDQGDEDEDEDMADAAEEEVEDEVVDDDDEGEEEEVVDGMAVEEEELKRDQRGLEEGGGEAGEGNNLKED